MSLAPRFYRGEIVVPASPSFTPAFFFPFIAFFVHLHTLAIYSLSHIALNLLCQLAVQYTPSITLEYIMVVHTTESPTSPICLCPGNKRDEPARTFPIWKI